jgi:hypothetical protein
MIMDRTEYYSDNRVLFEMVKIAKGRELSFLSPDLRVRNIKAHCISYLISNFKAFSFFKEPHNVYYSLAHLFDMPVFSFNMALRAKQSKEFNDKFASYMVDYDLGIDMDSKEHGFKLCLEETAKVKGLFDEYKVPYSLRMSGNGFHINVDGKYIVTRGDGGVLGKIETCKQFAYELSVLLNLLTLDLTIYDNRRIWKLPYSYDCKSGNICLPLSDDQFTDFFIDIVKPENVLNLNLINRGLLERNQGSDGFEKLRGDLCG